MINNKNTKEASATIKKDSGGNYCDLSKTSLVNQGRKYLTDESRQ